MKGFLGAFVFNAATSATSPIPANFFENQKAGEESLLVDDKRTWNILLQYAAWKLIAATSSCPINLWSELVRVRKRFRRRRSLKVSPKAQ